jgi:hypothetical protein
LATDSEVRVRFPALLDFQRSSGLERCPFSLVNTIEKLLGSGSGLENREYGRRDPPRWLRDTLLYAKVVTNFTDKWRSLSRYSSLLFP